MTSRRRLLLLLSFVSVFAIGAAPARANFDDIVRAVESKYRVQRTTIPFFGLVRAVLWAAHPDGVSDVQLATFDNAHIDDVEGLAEIVNRNAGESMQRLVQTRSNRNGEATLIFAHPLPGNRVVLLVFAHDHEDTTLVRVVMSVDKFTEAMNRPDGVAAAWR